MSFFTKISNNNSIAKEGLTRSGIIENDRPVSSRTFVSKLLERMVAKQLHDHLSQHQLYEKHQHIGNAIALKRH